ncbi:MAG TPA: hypothetical protein DCZ40_00120 [Lachnospiraceae bacterium]|nr:hypothetical protein [Lachnospiraceae bacterium]
MAEKSESYVILIAMSMAYQENIYAQLESLRFQDDIECYSLQRMMYDRRKTDYSCRHMPQPKRLNRVFGWHGIGICHESRIKDDKVFLSNDYIVC